MMHVTDRRRLGKSGVEVTIMGFGGAPLGNMYQAFSDQQARATVDACYDAGIRYFDTAPLYGFGLSEHRLGEALRDKERAELVLSTKVGRLLRPGDPTTSTMASSSSLPFGGVYDYSYDGVMRSVEDSLQRLGTRRIDILCWSTTSTSGPTARRKRGAPGSRSSWRAAIGQWSSCASKVRCGRSVPGSTRPGMPGVAERGDFDCFLLAGRYTLLEQAPLDEFLPLCERRNIALIIGGPYNTGILATGAVEGAYFQYAPAPPEIMARVRRIEAAVRAPWRAPADRGAAVPARPPRGGDGDSRHKVG